MIIRKGQTMIYNNTDYEKNIIDNDKMNDQTSDTTFDSTSSENTGNKTDPKKHGKRTCRAGGRYVKKAVTAISLGIIFGVCSFGGALAVSHFTGDKLTASGSTQQITTNGSATPSADNALAKENTDKTVTTTSSTDTKTVTTDVTNVVSAAMPSIVSIDNNYTETVTSMFGQSGEEEETASGSGIIVGKSDSELLIATNNHVVENSDSLKVKFIDDTEASADIKGTDSSMDLAVIAVQLSDLSSDTLDSITVATLGDSDSLQVGEPAIAIGNALGIGQSVTTGVISAVNREIELSDNSTGTFIQTDAAINPGNSGGALLNSNGEVIGINSNKIGGTTIEGMGYAIPISKAEPIINKLMNQSTKVKVEDSKKGALGISVLTPTGVEGAYVADVEDSSAAAKGGIEAGDLITKLDDTEITSRDDLENALKYYAEGTKVTVTVLRRGDNGYEEQTLSVTLQAASSLNTSNSETTNDGNTNGGTTNGGTANGGTTNGGTTNGNTNNGSFSDGTGLNIQPSTGNGSGSAANYLPQTGNGQSIFGN